MAGQPAQQVGLQVLITARTHPSSQQKLSVLAAVGLLQAQGRDQHCILADEDESLKLSKTTLNQHRCACRDAPSSLLCEVVSMLTDRADATPLPQAQQEWQVGLCCKLCMLPALPR